MTLAEYQEAALRTANKGADTKARVTIAALGLSGEAGEFADMIKKFVGHGHAIDDVSALKELGDVLWYVAEASSALGFSLETVAQGNIDKLRRRYPQGFSEAASKARVDVP